MISIFFVIANVKIGGGVRVILELASQLSKLKKYRVKVFFTGESQDLLKEYKLEYVNYKMKEEKNIVIRIVNIMNFNYYISKNIEKNDILFFGGPLIASLGLFTGHVKQRFFYVQNDEYNLVNDLIKSNLMLRLYKGTLRTIYSLPMTFLFTSDFSYRSFLKYTFRQKTSKKLLHPAIGQNFLQADTSKRKNSSIIRFSTMARLHHSKGFDQFLKACEIYAENNQTPFLVTIISQEDFSGFSFPKNFRVLKPGSDAEIVDQLIDTDIFVSTSKFEGFCLPPLEAMACGCACIISNNGGSKEYAVDKENALLYEYPDVNTLANHMRKLASDIGLRNHLSRSGLRTVQKFHPESLAIQFQSYLELD
jgi:glycosyltransferase involved in cell wall biosynthesis